MHHGNIAEISNRSYNQYYRAAFKTTTCPNTHYNAFCIVQFLQILLYLFLFFLQCHQPQQCSNHPQQCNHTQHQRLSYQTKVITNLSRQEYVLTVGQVSNNQSNTAFPFTANRVWALISLYHHLQSKHNHPYPHKKKTQINVCLTRLT